MPARSLCCRAFERQGLGDRGSEGAVPALQGFLVALQQGGTRRSESPHFFRYAEITDAELPEHRLHIGGELIHELLGEVARLRVSLEAKEHGEQVEREDDEASFERIGNSKALIENGKPRLRHNCAIEFLGAEVFLAPRKQGNERAQRTGLRCFGSQPLLQAVNKAAFKGGQALRAKCRSLHGIEGRSNL